MYEYIRGKITAIENNYIVLENNSIGYIINVANPYSYEENEEALVYLYQQVKEDELNLYGFKNKDEKALFLSLISVKGLGCKMALPMFVLGSTSGIIDAIERENILYLKKFPKIGDKIARQIILDLKGKLVSSKEVLEKDFNELAEVLKGLGYRQADINRVLPNINNSLEIEEQVKTALKLLLR